MRPASWPHGLLPFPGIELERQTNACAVLDTEVGARRSNASLYRRSTSADNMSIRICHGKNPCLVPSLELPATAGMMTNRYQNKAFRAESYVEHMLTSQNMV